MPKSVGEIQNKEVVTDMRELALKYYRQGYNCSQCILMAAQQTYKLSVPKPCFNMCSGVNMGFGIGNMCSVVIAGVMVFGLMFDTGVTKKLRLKLMTQFKEKYGNFNCSVLIKEHNQCADLIQGIADMIDKLIKEETSGNRYR